MKKRSYFHDEHQLVIDFGDRVTDPNIAATTPDDIDQEAIVGHVARGKRSARRREPAEYSLVPDDLGDCFPCTKVINDAGDDE